MRNDETRDTLHRRGTDSRVQNVKSTRSCALRAYPWCAVTRASMGRAAQLPIHVHPAVLGILPMHAAQHITSLCWATGNVWYTSAHCAHIPLSAAKGHCVLKCNL